jgi:tetratricopeptide (TPR) repeat protein
LLKEGCDLAAKDTPEDLKKAIEKFSEIKTANVDMVYLRGNAHLRLGIPIHHQAAIDDFTQAIRFVNGSKSLAEKFLYTTELYYKRAFAHQMLGENDDAIHDYTLFIARANNKGSHVLAAKGYLSRGLVYESIQRMHKAFNDINKASELTLKKNPYYEYCRERVRIAVLEIHDDMDDETEHSNVSVRENENNAHNQGNKEFTNNETPTSSEQQMDSDMTSDESNVSYEEVFYNALLCSEQGDVQKALEKFKEACEITSNRYQKAESLFRQGLCYYKLDEKPEARKSFEKARNYNPQHARAIFRLGMMQAADRELKDALQTISLAYKYAPNHVDILYERANVFEKMGKLQEAVYDRRRAMQLTQQSKNTIATIEDHIRHIKAEIAKEGESSIRRFKIGLLQQTRQRFYENQNFYPHQDKLKIINVTKTNNYFYEEAINEYRAAIDLDKEQHCRPEAHALLSLCLDQVNDILPAQQGLQTLLENFKNFPQFLSMWKSFIKNVQNPNYWNEMGAPPSYIILIQINRIEKIQKDIESDEESFKGD